MKKVIPTKQGFNLFQWERLFEEAMEVLNNRPLGMTGDLEVLTPNHLRPVHSTLAPSLAGFCEEILTAKKKFDEQWFNLYQGSVLKQTKWSTSSHTLHIHDIVIINDLLNVLHYPVIGRIKGIENDSQGTPRWYTVEYKHLKINPKAKQASERICKGRNSLQ